MKVNGKIILLSHQWNKQSSWFSPFISCCANHCISSPSSIPFGQHQLIVEVFFSFSNEDEGPSTMIEQVRRTRRVTATWRGAWGRTLAHINFPIRSFLTTTRHFLFSSTLRPGSYRISILIWTSLAIETVRRTIEFINLLSRFSDHQCLSLQSLHINGFDVQSNRWCCKFFYMSDRLVNIA